MLPLVQSVEAIVSEPDAHSLESAFAYCAKITESHYENFPVASLFLPEDRRPYIQAIYAFSRAADDFADEPGRTDEERLRLLADWEVQLERCYQGEASHPVFVALGETVRRLGIPIEPLKDLLAAFRRDVGQNRYETFADLQSYCACSANPVGRLVLLIFGYRDPALFELSDAVCTGLQLANFWQDLAIDLEKDRLYLPLEDMRRFSYDLADWKRRTVNDGFRALMKFQVERTRELFHRGAPLPARVNKDLEIELKLVWFGGMTVLRKLERAGYDAFNRRPSLSLLDKLFILGKTILLNDLTRYGRRKESWDLTP
jgi:squalene synthase HpnC